jgi:hypothetical protein
MRADQDLEGMRRTIAWADGRVEVDGSDAARVDAGVSEERRESAAR